MIYVMSDIHGNERRFNSVMKQIRLRPEDTLYILGDVIDRHPGGIHLIRRIISMPNVRMILGNHEYMMLNALASYDKKDWEAEYDHEEAVKLWYRNGGRITHHYFKHNRKAVQEEIVEFLKSLPLSYDVELNGKKYKLVHAAPAELYEQYRIGFHNAIEFAVWKRWNDYIPTPPGFVVIFGHTPTVEYHWRGEQLTIWKSEHVIDIDCGSGFSDEPDPWYHVQGRLACLRLDDMKEFYSTEITDNNYNQGCEQE